jgi:hypothetical protein
METLANKTTGYRRFSKPRWMPATIGDLEDMENRIRMIEKTLDQQIADLAAEVTNATTVKDSVLTLIQGIPALIAAAVAKATAAGATPAQLQAISDLQATLASNDTVMAAAVVAGTPAAS